MEKITKFIIDTIIVSILSILFDYMVHGDLRILVNILFACIVVLSIHFLHQIFNK